MSPPREEPGAHHPDSPTVTQSYATQSYAREDADMDRAFDQFERSDLGDTRLEERLDDLDRQAARGPDVGLFVLRLVVGLILAGHGSQKLFGWLGGPGLEGWETMLTELGYQPARWFALAHATAELTAGVLLVFGLLTPFAAAALIGVAVNALPTKIANGFWIQDGGFEYEVVLLAVGSLIAIAGPGSLSLDRRLPWARGGVASAMIGLVLGFGSGIAVLVVGPG
ncbi:MAG: DoxX family protein [Carbonactinosporaceae bacterium]